MEHRHRPRDRAYVMWMLDGNIRCHKDPMRGACFSVAIARYAPALGALDD
jgi:hypothetical protein